MHLSGNDMTNALKLRAKVYEKIHPDGIPLEFGCEVKKKGAKAVGTIVGMEWCGKENKYRVLYGVARGLSVNHRLLSSAEIEVIGKSLTLQDVLRAMDGKIYHGEQLILFWTGKNYEKPCLNMKNKKGTYTISIDLTNDIEDQEDVCKQLLELL